MSTFFDAAIFENRGVSHEEVAALVLPLASSCAFTELLLVYISTVERDSSSFTWLEFADEHAHNVALRGGLPGSPARIAAERLSLAYRTRALRLQYSDREGTTTYAAFESGVETVGRFSQIDSALAIEERAELALSQTFPDLNALDPYQAVELFLEENSNQQAFIVGRSAAALSSPEIYEPSPPRSARRLHVPRAVHRALDVGCRSLVLAWAALMGLLLLGALVWFASELLR